MTEKLSFADISKMDVGEHIEKKMNLSYLSWAWAYAEMRKLDENASYKIIEFIDHEKLIHYAQAGVELSDQILDACKINYKKDNAGAYVEVEVTMFGRAIKESLPVMNFKNQAMTNPTSMDINKAHKRCFVKALAHHGLGLYIYAGEDLPESKDNQGDNLEFNHSKEVEEPQDTIEERIEKGYKFLVDSGKYTSKQSAQNAMKKAYDAKSINEINLSKQLGWLLGESKK